VNWAIALGRHDIQHAAAVAAAQLLTLPFMNVTTGRPHKPGFGSNGELTATVMANAYSKDHEWGSLDWIGGWWIRRHPNLRWRSTYVGAQGPMALSAFWKDQETHPAGLPGTAQYVQSSRTLLYGWSRVFKSIIVIIYQRLEISSKPTSCVALLHRIADGKSFHEFAPETAPGMYRPDLLSMVNVFKSLTVDERKQIFGCIASVYDCIQVALDAIQAQLGKDPLYNCDARDDLYGRELREFLGELSVGANLESAS
jgi:hypothetical protein